MSISDNYAPDKSLGNSSTVEFTGNWSPLVASYFKLALEAVATGVQTLQTQGDDYTLTFDDDGYVATMDTAPSSDYYVVRYREIEQNQTVPLRTSKGFQGYVHENALDKLTAIDQDQQDAISRTLKFQVGATGITNAVLPAPVDGYGIVWDGTDGSMKNTTASLAALEGDAALVAANLATIELAADLVPYISDIEALAPVASDIAIVADNIGDLQGVVNSLEAKVKVSADDEEANYLGAKVAEGDYMQITEAAGGNEVITFTVDAAGIAALAFTTGDIKLTLKTVADTGWVMFDDGTIGNAASGATTRANADTEALFTLLWTNVSNTYAAVSGGRGASAAADYAANKTIALTKMLGRALGIAGAGSGLTSRALGFTVGTETHQLLEAEMPSHNHTVTAWNGTSGSDGASVTIARWSAGTANNQTTSSKGSGTAHNNMQPTTFLNAMVKL